VLAFVVERTDQQSGPEALDAPHVPTGESCENLNDLKTARAAIAQTPPDCAVFARADFHHLGPVKLLVPFVV
jgi:hypothetical protein